MLFRSGGPRYDQRRGGIGRGRLAEHNRGVEQVGVAVVLDEAPRSQGADAVAVGGDEDQCLLVAGAGERFASGWLLRLVVQSDGDGGAVVLGISS